VAGFSLVHERDQMAFSVWCGHQEVSENTVRLECKDIVLTTKILPGAMSQDRETIQMAADLEQCATMAMGSGEREGGHSVSCRAPQPQVRSRSSAHEAPATACQMRAPCQAALSALIVT
jgi:hypothetical protein